MLYRFTSEVTSELFELWAAKGFSQHLCYVLIRWYIPWLNDLPLHKVPYNVLIYVDVIAPTVCDWVLLWPARIHFVLLSSYVVQIGWCRIFIWEQFSSQVMFSFLKRQWTISSLRAFLAVCWSFFASNHLRHCFTYFTFVNQFAKTFAWLFVHRNFLYGNGLIFVPI